MYLLWISGFDISHMWMSPWLNGLESASSALHIMYYSSLFARKSLYRLYIIHFVPQPRQDRVYLDSSSTATNINTVCIIKGSFSQLNTHSFTVNHEGTKKTISMLLLFKWNDRGAWMRFQVVLKMYITSNVHICLNKKSFLVFTLLTNLVLA